MVVQPELLLGHKTNMELVFLQENVISRETVTGIKPRLFFAFVRHCCLFKDNCLRHRENITTDTTVKRTPCDVALSDKYVTSGSTSSKLKAPYIHTSHSIRQ